MYKLYRSDKYKVFIGNREDIGFITCWSEPERIFGKISDDIGILSTLYSKYGVNIILRNLALNPNIRKIYLWSNEALSRTNIGFQGANLLRNLFINKNLATITDFKFESEIDITIINQILNDVEFVDISHIPYNELKTYLVNQTSTPVITSRESVDFPEPKVDEDITFPSENVGFIVRGVGIFDTWAKAVDKITRYGKTYDTQYGYKHRQLISLTWIIENEPDIDNIKIPNIDLPKDLTDKIGFEQVTLENYAKEVWMTSDVKTGVSYTYGNRLRKYPISNSNYIDQIELYLIIQLQKSLNTRRAFATSIVPEIDANSSEQPCFVFLQALVEGDTLNLLSLFRSQDIFKAGILNAYGLLSIQQELCDRLNLKKGSLKITSESAHIYEQDWVDAKNLVKCYIRDREPSMIFDPSTTGDPRGSFLVRITQDKIEVEMQDKLGNVLLNISGSSAKYLSLKLSKLELFGEMAHAMDIAMELQKAELCLKNNIKYMQDRPIILKN